MAAQVNPPASMDDILEQLNALKIENKALRAKSAVQEAYNEVISCCAKVPGFMAALGEKYYGVMADKMTPDLLSAIQKIPGLDISPETVIEGCTGQGRQLPAMRKAMSLCLVLMQHMNVEQAAAVKSVLMPVVTEKASTWAAADKYLITRYKKFPKLQEVYLQVLGKEKEEEEEGEEGKEEEGKEAKPEAEYKEFKYVKVAAFAAVGMLMKCGL